MKKILDLIMILCCMAASLFCFASCSDDLDIQQEYPFTVEAMPVADKIVGGRRWKSVWKLPEEGNFSGTLYTLRYFQPDGNGLLKLEDGTVLKPNDRYLLGEKKFRLYYTSRSTNEAQTIDLYFENNWQDVRQLSFSFNNRNDGAEKTEGGARVPVN